MSWRGLSQEEVNPIYLESAGRGLSMYDPVAVEAHPGPSKTTHFFSASLVPGYVDENTVRLRLLPSGTETFITPATDAATVSLTFTPSGVDILSAAIAPLALFLPSTPPIIVPGPWPTTQVWRVVHYNHSDQAVGDCFPSNPEFAIYLGKVGYLNYDLDGSHELARRQTTEAYGTDFKLYRGKRPVLGGLHTSVSIAPNAEERGFSVSGKDWLHWFETQFWPFDPDDPTGNLYLATDADVFVVIKDLFDEVLSQPNEPTFTYNFGLMGSNVDFKIDPNDTENILSKVTTLGQRVPDSFDLEVTHDRQIFLHAPKQGTLRDLVLEQGSNIYQLGYTDEGPKGTHILATAHGTSATAGAIVNHPNQAKYRRIMLASELSDIQDASIMPSLAQGEADRAATPHTTLTCTVVPDFLDDLFAEISVGDILTVRGDIGYDEIDQQLRLVSIIGRPNDEGDEEYELGFDDGTLAL